MKNIRKWIGVFCGIHGVLVVGMVISLIWQKGIRMDTGQERKFLQMPALKRVMLFSWMYQNFQAS